MELIGNYKDWLIEVKDRIRKGQIKAALSVNRQLLELYWDFGEDFTKKQMDAHYGSSFFETLSNDLKAEFPDMKGFSPTNLKYCKRFYQFYSQDIEIRQEAIDEFKGSLFSIPWGHNIDIFTKSKTVKEAIFYVQKTLENNWSRAVLINFIDAKLYETQGKAISNFKAKLPPSTSDLAQQILKDPYNFDFLSM